MNFAAMSAIDLQREIDRAAYYSEEGESNPLLHALKEVDRLRTVCQDIIEVIGVEYAQSGNAEAALEKIDDIAHKYFIVDLQ